MAFSPFLQLREELAITGRLREQKAVALAFGMSDPALVLIEDAATVHIRSNPF